MPTPEPGCMPFDCVPLTASPLFQGAPAPLLMAMMAGCETKELAAGEYLLRAGQQNDVLYLILEGTVDVHLPETGRLHVRLGPGECVGELSLLDGFHVTADVQAEVRTVVLAIERDTLWHLLERAPIVARNLLRLLAGRVRYDDRVLQEGERTRRAFEEAATIDALTGLRNRRWFEDAFARQLERSARMGRPVSALMIDADHFKQVNDQHGHLVGDRVLVHIARTLAAHVRPSDLIARFGGEEFVALLPDLAESDAAAAADRLRVAVAESPVPDAPGVVITVSAGVATSPPAQPLDLAALVGRADRALALAKRGGRNRVCVFAASAGDDPAPSA